MRVAHWCIWAPSASGMFETAATVVQGQQRLGLDCALIDALEPTVQKTDGKVTTKTADYAATADIYVMHSHIPPEYLGDGTPVVMFLHGDPLYSWTTQCYDSIEPGNNGAWDAISWAFQPDSPVKRFISLWPDQMPVWELLDQGRGRTRLLPSAIDTDWYTPHGEKADLAGDPVLLIADQARLIKEPFQVFMAAALYHQQNPKAKLHFIGMPFPSGSFYRRGVQWGNLVAQPALNDVVGSYGYIAADPRPWYRRADMLVSTATGTSRVVKEALSSGMDVLHATAERSEGIWPILPHDYQRTSETIAEVAELRREQGEGRRQYLWEVAQAKYGQEAMCRGAIAIYEELLHGDAGLPRGHR